MEKIYRDADVDLGVLDGKTLAVIGYGIQGKAQAANARDSGCRRHRRHPPRRGRAKSPAQAKLPTGSTAYSIAEVTRRADVLLIELADPVQPAIFKADITAEPPGRADGGASATALASSTGRSCCPRT